MLAVPAVCALSLKFFRNFQFMGRFEKIVWVLLCIGTKTSGHLISWKFKDSATRIEICDCISASK